MDNNTKGLALILAPIVFVLMLMTTVVVVIGGGSLECETDSIDSDTGMPGYKVMPMKKGTYQLTSPFGPRGGAMHQGQDFGSTPKQPIYAAFDGKVVQSGPASGFGEWIVLAHNLDGEHVETVYGHMFADDLLVRAGDKVNAGQQIARAGYNGEVSPPGPGGTHLHFEVWKGIRDGGGNAVDPMVWLRGAAEPGTKKGELPPPPSSGVPQPTPQTPSTPRAPPTDVADQGADPSGTPPPGSNAQPDAGGELDISKPLATARGSETGLQIDAVRVMRAVGQRFPQVKQIGGWRANGGYASDHVEGRAVDFMIPNPTSGEGIALGNAIRDYIHANAKLFNLQYTIWRQFYKPAGQVGNIMPDRFDFTQNHFDHVHVSTNTSARYSGQDLGTIRDRGADGLSGGSDDGECEPDNDGHEGGPLKPGTAPPEWAKWYQKAGGICPDISSSLLAAQGQQETGFRADVTSPAGADGPGQFMPGTWPSWGKDYDGDGKVDIRSPGDAIMAQGHFMCSLAKQMRGWVDKGQVREPSRGGIAALALAGYNAGPGAVQQARGVPPYPETIKYVDIILTNEPRFRESATANAGNVLPEAGSN